MSHNPAAGPGPQGPQYTQQPPQKKGKKKWVLGCLGLVFLVIILFAGCSALLGSGTEDPGSGDNRATSTPVADPTEDAPATEEAEAEEAEATEVESQPAESEAEVTGPEQNAEQSSLTVAQQNAVRSAENYISFTAFSRTGLIEQLVFEDYSTEDATVAVDSLDIDYNEQAAKAAQNYLDMTGFSRGGLIEQLMFEGYTAEQAAYGADQVGL